MKLILLGWEPKPSYLYNDIKVPFQYLHVDMINWPGDALLNYICILLEEYKYKARVSNYNYTAFYLLSFFRQSALVFSARSDIYTINSPSYKWTEQKLCPKQSLLFSIHVLLFKQRNENLPDRQRMESHLQEPLL